MWCLHARNPTPSTSFKRFCNGISLLWPVVRWRQTQLPAPTELSGWRLTDVGHAGDDKEPNTSDPAAVCPLHPALSPRHGPFGRCNGKSKSAISGQKAANGRHPAPHKAPRRPSLTGPMQWTYPRRLGRRGCLNHTACGRSGVLLGRWAKRASCGQDAI